MKSQVISPESAWKVSLARLALGKFLRPFRAVVDRGGQGHHRLERKLQPACLILQKSSGLLVEPVCSALL